MNPGHATQLPPNLFHQNILNAQKQVRNLVGENNTHGTDQTGGGKVIMTDEEAARRAVEAQGFIGELEAILNTWRPIYFDNKRGRRLNVVSDRSAPKHLIKSLNESLGVEVDPLQSDVDYDHIDTFKGKQIR